MMKLNWRNIFCAAGLLISCFARAQNGAGNGGDGIVYRNLNGDLTSIETLDLWEGRTFHSNEPMDLGPNTWTAAMKVSYALDRFAKLDPIRAEIFKTEALKFLAQSPDLVEVWHGISLRDIDDSDNVGIPRGSHIEQVVVQGVPTYPRTKFYTVDGDLWTAMDANSQAAMALHEVIYKYAIALGQINSVNTRRFNIFVMSDSLKNPTVADFETYDHDYIGALRMGDRVAFVQDGLMIDPRTIVRNNIGNVIEATLSTNYSSQATIRVDVSGSSQTYGKFDVMFVPKSQVQFYDDGKTKNMKFLRISTTVRPMPDQYETYTYSLVGYDPDAGVFGELLFAPTGGANAIQLHGTPLRVEAYRPSDPEDYFLRTRFCLTNHSNQMEFYETGMIKSGQLVTQGYLDGFLVNSSCGGTDEVQHSSTFRLGQMRMPFLCNGQYAQGPMVWFNSDTPVTFYPTGWVKSADVNGSRPTPSATLFNAQCDKVFVPQKDAISMEFDTNGLLTSSPNL